MMLRSFTVSSRIIDLIWERLPSLIENNKFIPVFLKTNIGKVTAKEGSWHFGFHVGAFASSKYLQELEPDWHRSKMKMFFDAVNKFQCPTSNIDNYDRPNQVSEEEWLNYFNDARNLVLDNFPLFIRKMYDYCKHKKYICEYDVFDIFLYAGDANENIASC